MTHRERVMRCCERRSQDRIPIKHEGTPEVNQGLKEHFGLKNEEQLLVVLGDDFRSLEPRYVGPELRTFPDGSVEGYFGERYIYVQFSGGRYLESVYRPYEGILELGDLDRSHYPSADWFEYRGLAEKARRLRAEGYAVCIGSAGDMDFINSIARARGFEQVLMDLIDDSEVYLDIMQARFRFYYETHERILKECGGLVDFAHVGDDLGNQLGPMISMDIFDRHFAGKYRDYFKMVHSHGARTMMHMCGTVWPFLDRLIELGLDVYDVVQPTTPENDIASLRDRFGTRLLFQGSMDVQKELAFGTTEEVEREVARRLELFPRGGLILGPSHAIQAKSPVENVVAMYRMAGSLMDSVPAWVLDIEGPEAATMSMSKLF
jgi:uroporphyrinogen decarboxylase